MQLAVAAAAQSREGEVRSQQMRVNVKLGVPSSRVTAFLIPSLTGAKPNQESEER